MVALCYISKEKQNGCLFGVINSTQWLLWIDMINVMIIVDVLQYENNKCKNYEIV